MFNNKIMIHFTKDHEYHQKLFKQYLYARKNSSKNLTDIYNELRNSIKRHTNQEESIYSEFEIGDEFYKILERIREEHDQLINILDKSYDLISETFEEDLEKFENLLNEHKEVEEKILYPEFDKKIIKNSEIIDDLDLYDPID